jgi:hypothetical protein
LRLRHAWELFSIGEASRSDSYVTVLGPSLTK